MEKFARQAINDGATGVEELSVSRDCELFRALNMHYNKANDFEVTVSASHHRLKSESSRCSLRREAESKWGPFEKIKISPDTL